MIPAKFSNISLFSPAMHFLLFSDCQAAWLDSQDDINFSFHRTVIWKRQKMVKTLTKKKFLKFHKNVDSNF